MKLACMQAQSVKLFGDRVVEHPARQGERYIRPSDPHTLRNKLKVTSFKMLILNIPGHMLSQDKSRLSCRRRRIGRRSSLEEGWGSRSPLAHRLVGKEKAS